MIEKSKNIEKRNLVEPLLRETMINLIKLWATKA
jgi:hypothetical protein